MICKKVGRTVLNAVLKWERYWNAPILGCSAEMRLTGIKNRKEVKKK